MAVPQPSYSVTQGRDPSKQNLELLHAVGALGPRTTSLVGLHFPSYRCQSTFTTVNIPLSPSICFYHRQSSFTTVNLVLPPPSYGDCYLPT